ncbi:hypothetical protein SAY86_011649 [Trapa natans]|uniref:RWP-RK domain-containing protein n=1 Tax=Trapa natans TaxID=22666 RepID=A0AAN7R5B1_TRANT|nr:hypothetical protein SAY86_011649 [Trapa natans]
MGDPEQSVVPDLDSLDVSSFFTTDMNSILSWNPLAAIHSSFLPLEPNINPGPCLLPSSTLGDYQGFHHHPGAEPVAITEQATVIPFSDQSAWSISLGDASLSYGGGPGFDPVASAPTVPDVSIASGGLSAPTQNVEYDNQSPSMLFSWPPPATPFVCSCCQVLREIIHIHGNHMIKLELHGRPGTIIHAILENRSADNHIGDVKEFLLRYCEEKILAGYKLVPDPLSTYYEAVCVGLVWDNIVSGPDDFLRSSPPTPGNSRNTHRYIAAQASGGPSENAPPIYQQSRQPVQNNGPDGANPRTSIARQRERAGKLTLKDLAHYFHLPLENAAEILKLCPTVVKKICRRGGLKRWPHRKIRSLKKKIKKLHPRLASRDPEERQAAQADLKSLQQQLLEMRFGVPEASSSVV